MADKPKVFFIMPFEQDFFDLYEEFKNRFGESFDFSHAGDLDNQRNIIQDIVVGIAEADIIIADLTGLNPNVFYELGIAHTMDKKTIVITQNIDDLPFDIQPYRANQYSLKFNKIPSFMKEMEKLLNGAIDGSVNYGNPVKDFAPIIISNISYTGSTQVEDTQEIEITNGNNEEDDYGFLDYVANIELKNAAVLDSLFSIINGMETIKTETNSANIELNKVKARSGRLDPIFAQSVCKKLAEPINKFAVELKGNINDISENWDDIENSYFGLLDNPFIKTPANIASLQRSVEQLKNLQPALITSKSAIETLMGSLSGSIGIERKLTKAVRLLQEGLSSYLFMTDKMFASIDRIIIKSNLIIND